MTRGAAESPEPWLTTADVARLLRRTPATIRRWAKLGTLPPAGKLPDGGYLFEMEAVRKLVGADAPVRHAMIDPDAVRAFVDSAYRRATGGRRG